MKDCILCGKQTEGSVGAAGYKWSFICQPCKDSEDKDIIPVGFADWKCSKCGVES